MRLADSCGTIPAPTGARWIRAYRALRGRGGVVLVLVDGRAGAVAWTCPGSRQWLTRDVRRVRSAIVSEEYLYVRDYFVSADARAEDLGEGRA